MRSRDVDPQAPAALMQYRLAPDMLPFTRQIRIACAAVKNGLARRDKSKGYFVRGVVASRSAMRSSSAQTSAIRPEIIRRPACAGACPVSSTRTTRSGTRLAEAARTGRAGSPTLTRPGVGCKATATESRMPDVARRQLASLRLKNAQVGANTANAASKVVFMVVP